MLLIQTPGFGLSGFGAGAKKPPQNVIRTMLAALGATELTHWSLPSIRCIGFQSPKQHCPLTAIGQVPASEHVHPSGTSRWDLSTPPNVQQQQTCQE